MFIYPLNFEKMEANLARLNNRIPGVPVESVVLSRLLIYLGRGMANLLEQEIRPFGLAETEFRILTILFSQPDGAAHPGDLCANTSQTPANMSRLSDSLVARNYITRELSEHDRRRMVLRITPQGEDLVQRLLPALFEGLGHLFRDFPLDEQRQLIDLLKTLGTKLSQDLTRHGTERTVS